MKIKRNKNILKVKNENIINEKNELEVKSNIEKNFEENFETKITKIDHVQSKSNSFNAKSVVQHLGSVEQLLKAVKSLESNKTSNLYELNKEYQNMLYDVQNVS